MRIGLDIGGTKIEAVVLSHSGLELFRQRVETPANYEQFVTVVCDLVLSAEREVGVSCTVGIGLPGAICPHSGLMKNANCTFLNGHDLISDLATNLERTVYIANDANCFVLSEAIDGAGKGSSVVFGAVLGTGCGGGLVVNKHLITGKNAISGEWGHNSLPNYSPEVDGPERTCYCGKKNCIESFISGTGFRSGFNQKHGTNYKAPEIIDLCHQGDETALAAYRLLVDQIARSVASIINVIDPDTFVVGGGMSNVPNLVEDVESAVPKYLFSLQAVVDVKKAKFGDASGVRGAAWLPPEAVSTKEVEPCT
ncbi:ROK family glucokinase [Vibrio ishigakensis]|uniref:ROK family glucokinase n=1 Tax=Vibrio ishigakensis TaxID=1481914 RepID=A0A0B8Q704_9VIBR|nr:ROK family glucokinase [Vibrio ishigakensis]